MRGDYRALFLVITVVASYLVFLGVAIPSAISLDGDCLYKFWAPDDLPSFNPYWLFVYLVGALTILALVLTVVGYKQALMLNVITGIVLIFVLSLWLGTLNDLWKAIQYERGEISEEEWQRSNDGAVLSLPYGDLRACSDNG